jgi:ABC-type Fe3+-hydroxamate transport system substrate-binding protein
VTAAGPLVDDLGARVRLDTPPRRIASLVPNLSELLADWGLAGRVVAVTDHCVEPVGAFPAAVRVRGTKNPDLAAIVALAPDLVLASEEENRELDVRRLRAAGLVVHVTRVRGLHDLPGSLDRLGRVLDVDERARRLIARLEGRRPRPPGARPRVACAVWRDAPERPSDEEGWWLLGRDTYGAAVVAAAGGELVPADPEGRYPRLPWSWLCDAAPDVVLLPDEPYAFGPSDQQQLAACGLHGVLVDGKALWWWGMRTPAAIDAIAGLLHPSAAAQ